MNQDPYELDAAVRNQDAARQRTVKNKEVAKKDLPENITPINFDVFNQVTTSRLDCLRQGTFNQPVISLYINLSPDRQIRQKEIYLTLYNSLKHSALQGNQAYINQLTHQQKSTLDADLLQVHEYLQHRFDASESRSIAMFKSGDQLSWLFTLPTPGEDYMAIDPDPYTLPLTISHDRQHSLMVLKVESGLASFYAYRNGNLNLLEVIKSQVPDLSIDMSRPNKVQRHNYTHLQQHLKKAAERLNMLAKRHRLLQLVLVGDEHIVNLFKKDNLDKDKQDKIVATLSVSPETSQAELAQRIYELMEQQEVAEEGYYLDMLHKEEGQNGLIKGLDEVISAQNRHMVRSLIVDKDLKQKGYYCDHDNFVSTDAASCPLCGREMLMIENVVDKIVELASHFQVDYKVIRQNTDQMEEFGGIAATMYDVQ